MATGVRTRSELNGLLPETYGTVLEMDVLSAPASGETADSGDSTQENRPPGHGDGRSGGVASLDERSRGAGEAVYRVRLAGQQGTSVRYVREVAHDRVDGVRALLDLEHDIAIPDSELIGGPPYLLVMEPARGRPLSQLLPVLLLPGVWWFASTDLLAGVRDLGRAFGRLHGGTRKPDARVASVDAFERFLTYSDALARHVGEDSWLAIQRAIEELEAAEMAVAAIVSDPTPHNLYYAEGRIELIDFTVTYNLAVRDLVAFHRGVELMAGRLPYGRRSQVRRIVESFQRGYESTGPVGGFGKYYEHVRLVDYCYLLDRYLTGELGGETASTVQRAVRAVDIRLCTGAIDRLLECDIEWMDG